MAEKSNAYQVTIGKFVFTISDDDIASSDFVQKSPAEFNLIKDNRSVNIRLLEEDNTGKKIRLSVDGEIFEAGIKDGLDQMLDKMGYSAASTKQIKEIKAPMPGMVLNISVTEGQVMSEGERILILEAMKMENSIMIHANATIKKIKVKAGQAVDKGQVLVELE